MKNGCDGKGYGRKTRAERGAGAGAESASEHHMRVNSLKMISETCQ